MDGAVATAAAAITGYTVTPYVGSDGAGRRTRRRSDDWCARHRPDHRHDLHVQGHGDQRRRHGPGVRGASAVTPRESIFDAAAPATSTAATRAPSCSASSSARARRLHHRHALLQGGRTAARTWQPVDLDRHAAGARDLSNETASGWQAVTFATPVPITASTTYIASYLAPNGHYSVTPGRSPRRSTNPPLARWQTPRPPTASTATARRPSSRRTIQLDQLLGRRPVRPGPLIRPPCCSAA